MQRSGWILASVAALLAMLLACPLQSADWQTEWEKTLAAAKKEGTIVVGIPASSELRKAVDARFKEKFGIALELFPSLGKNHPEHVSGQNSGIGVIS